MTECINHHPACECREELMRMVAKTLLETHKMRLHDNVSRVTIVTNCICSACDAARELYPELEG